MKEFPIEEILTWQSVFKVYGPLNWEREDWRDARQTALQYATKGKRISDYLLYESPKEYDPREEYIKNLRTIATIKPEMSEKIEAKIRRVFREDYKNGDGSD